MTEIDLILTLMVAGFTGIFSTLLLMTKMFLQHKKESNIWKEKHSTELAVLKAEVEHIKDKT